MNTPNLGRLQKVELREAWASEASHFTPWLAQPDNLRLLGETIGIHLDPQAQEQSVGPFRADLLCKDVTSDAWVLIENQLERTDHSHLGQLLTYAAGLEAVTIVWIAQRFTDEHRAALDWLNEKTPDNINFFGLEVELWRIGDSPLAPKFNIVCKPNEWTRSVANVTAFSDVSQLCYDYWSGVLKALEPHHILTPTAYPQRRKDNVFDVGWSHFQLKAYFSQVEVKGAVWLSCRGPRGWENYQALFAARPEIEKAFGQPLDWEPDEPKHRGSISFAYNDINANNTADWPRFHQLTADRLAALYRAVAPMVKDLDGKPAPS